MGWGKAKSSSLMYIKEYDWWQSPQAMGLIFKTAMISAAVGFVLAIIAGVSFDTEKVAQTTEKKMTVCPSSSAPKDAGDSP